MAGEIKKVLFSEGVTVTPPSELSFDAADLTGVVATANGGTGVASTAVFPSTGTVAVTTDITAAFEGAKFKAPAIVATTADITLSGEQTLDGVLTSASRVLVKSQSAPEENGIYVSAAGAWARATDGSTWGELTSAIISVEQGSTLADTVWLCTANSGGTLGVTAVTWEQRAGAGGVDLTVDVTGTLPIANGGTGQTTANTALNALLPSQATHANKALVTNGTDTAWTAVATSVTTTRGDLIRRGASADERFSAVTNNRVVRGNGTDVVSGQIDNPAFFTTGAAASGTDIGIVTTAAQTFAGVKTFSSGISFGNETLSVYDEGTFTPEMADAISGGNQASYTTREGVYTRIGRICHFHITMDISSIGSMSGDVFIRGLPFTSKTMSGGFYQVAYIGLAGGTYTGSPVLYIGSNATWGYIGQVYSGSAGNIAISAANIGTVYMQITGTYVLG